MQSSRHHTSSLPQRLFMLLCLAISSGLQAGEPTLLKPGLYTGGQPNATQLQHLANQGVVTVIDLRTQDEDRGIDEANLVQALGMRYRTLPISSAADINADNARALKQLLDDSQGPVLLHCASGNRVGALLALIAAQEPAIDAESALKQGKAAGLTSLEPVVRERLGLPATQP